MDNQNNMFSNMIQANVIPEVKDSSPLGQVNAGGNNGINGNVNQVNDALGFGIPQNNMASDNMGLNVAQTNNSFIQSNVAPMTNNNSFIQPSAEVTPNNNSTINNVVAGPVMDLDNSVNQVNNNSLNFGLPPSGEMISPVNNDNNLGMVVTTDTNTSVNMGQSMLQPVDDSIKVDGGIINDASNPGFSINNGVVDISGVPSDINKDGNAVKSNENEEVVSVKQYLIHMVLCTIPIAGIIILIMRAINGKDKNITNLARAQLILTAVITLLSVVLTFVMGSLIASMFSGFY